MLLFCISIMCRWRTVAPSFGLWRRRRGDAPPVRLRSRPRLPYCLHVARLRQPARRDVFCLQEGNGKTRCDRPRHCKFDLLLVRRSRSRSRLRKAGNVYDLPLFYYKKYWQRYSFPATKTFADIQQVCASPFPSLATDPGATETIIP